jgi:hypothetical protein
MNNRDRKRFNMLTAGEMQSGKTYFTEQTANDYVKNGGIAFVYNAGKPEDFSDYEIIEVLTVPATMQYILQSVTHGKNEKERRNSMAVYKTNPKILYFRHNGRVYHFKNFVAHFMQPRQNRKVKILGGRLDRTDELLFFQTIYSYFANAFVMFDDAKTIFQSGLTQAQTQLLSRINHSGVLLDDVKYKGMGCDFAIIYHNLDKCSLEIYDYLTTIVLFYTTRPPQFEKIENEKLAKIMAFCMGQLNNAPAYTKAVIQITSLIYGEKSDIRYNIIKPKQS